MTPTPSVPEMLDAQYALIVHNHTPLYGPWKGWRLAGRDLVAPDGTRMNAQRLRGLAWRADSEERLLRARLKNAKAKAVRQDAVVKVLVVNLADWQAKHFGKMAG